MSQKKTVAIVKDKVMSIFETGLHNQVLRFQLETQSKFDNLVVCAFDGGNNVFP